MKNCRCNVSGLWFRNSIPGRYINQKWISRSACWTYRMCFWKNKRVLHGRSFWLQIDHQPLSSILGGLKNGILIHTINKFQCWGMILLNYNFKMVCIPSKKLGHEDCLSRLIPKKYETIQRYHDCCSLQAENEIKIVLCNIIRELPKTVQDIKSKLENDKFSAKMKEILNHFSLCDNVLMYLQKVVIPATL